MASWDDGALTPGQRAVVDAALGPAGPTDTVELVDDMSWHQVDTRVLRVRTQRGEFVVKAAGDANHHIRREIAAHEGVTAPLVRLGACGILVVADRAHNVLVTTYLRGVLVEGTAVEHSPELHLQAGRLLRTLHDQAARVDDDYEARATRRALERLDQPHRIDPETAERAREILLGSPSRPVTVVPTHGDWQPRNWLVDDGRLRVIDFGRFDHRPAATDLCPLASQQWRTEPALEEAFVAGYGGDPREPDAWRLAMLREAVGTAVWAFQVGDEPFEHQGHRMLADALARYSS